MLVLAIEEQPGTPQTYKVIVDGKVVSEHFRRGTALTQLVEELDRKMFPTHTVKTSGRKW